LTLVIECNGDVSTVTGSYTLHYYVRAFL
jgi:hypothetical protein